MKLTRLDYERVRYALETAKVDEIPVLSNCIIAFMRGETVTLNEFEKAMNIVNKQLLIQIPLQIKRPRGRPKTTHIN